MKEYFTLKSKSAISILCLWLAFVCSPSGVLAADDQTNTVSGRVTSIEDNTPLPGVNILEKGTLNGTVTDADGNFKISVAAGAMLVVSSIGYTSEEIPVNSQTEIAIALTPDVKILEQVLVVGYGSQNKSTFTGSAVALSSESLNKGTFSIENLMQGKVSGVQIFQNNATPGSPLSIRIRGTNSINAGSEPLFVIDGMPVSDGVGYSLNPSDVESITVLKDAASTAIYGARGANGVIMVTTKRGGDQKGKISLHSYYGVQNVTDQFDLSGPYDYAVRANKLAIESGNTAPYSASRIDSLSKGLIGGTNWQDEAFQTARIQSHDINFSGGSKNTSVYSSLNYLNQDGVIINTNYKRINARLNLEQRIGDKLKMTATGFGNYGVQNDLPLSPSTINGFLKQVVKANPLATPDSKLGAERDARNPLHFAAARDRKNVTLRMQGYFSFQYQIIKGLTAQLDLGADLNKSKAYDYSPSTIPAGASTNGLATIIGADQEDLLINPTLNYETAISNHNLKFLVGWNAQRTDYFEEGITASNFASDDFGYNQIGSASSFSAYTFKANPIKRQSWFGRVNYDYNDKYFFTGTYRVDGSSVFGDNQKLGYFPSAALAWRFSEEAFVKPLTFISNGKLRVSYGKAGNDRIPGGATKSTFSSDNTTSYTFGGTAIVSGVAATNFPNENLKWEETASFDVGLELGFFNERIILEADYYVKHTTDLLLLKPTPPSTGFTERLSNEAAVDNRGIELSLQTKNIDHRNFKWNTTITFAKNKNKIVKLSSSGAPIYLGAFKPEANANFEDPYVLKVGESIGSFNGYISDGIIQEGDSVLTGSHKNAIAGDPRYVNVDGNQILDEKDRVILGVGIAPITLGITNNFTYKNFSLDILMQGLFGGNLLNVQRADLLNPISSGNVLREVNTDTWSATDNTNGSIPVQGYYGTNHGGWVNSRFIEKSDFLRVKNVMLSYSLSPSFLKDKTVSGLTIYFNAQNLLTFTKYSGLDPEVGNTIDIANPLNRQQSRNVARGIDFNAYPVSKSYMVGIKLTL
jgi:TonB-dependent starch-binding outer membrane protein SusC